MGAVRVGVCSWADRGLVASGWYPTEKRGSEERLRYYAEHFDTVEVDASFYALPREEWVYRWVSRTPAGFTFHVKVFGLFTGHRVPTKNLPRWAREGVPTGAATVTLDDLPFSLRRALWLRFLQVLEPLRRMGKMGYLLFQFPRSFLPGIQAFRWLRRVGDVTVPFRTAVEVRNGAWFRSETRNEFLHILEEANMACVAVDEPVLPWTVSREEWPDTASWGAVVRFHGRNRDAWERTDATVAEKFCYRYRDPELLEWRSRILEKAESGKSVYVMFNNCYQDWAAKNALRMREHLGLDVPGGRSSQLVLFDDRGEGKDEL